MSSFYLDILKDRLYTAGPSSLERRSAQTVLTQILETMVKLMAPVLSFTAEEIWTHLHPSLKIAPSVHMSDWPKLDPSLRKQSLDQTWSQLSEGSRELVLKAIEPLRNEKEIGSSLEVGVVLSAKGELFNLLEAYQDQLSMIFIVSHVSIMPTDEDQMRVEVVKQKGSNVSVAGYIAWM